MKIDTNLHKALSMIYGIGVFALSLYFVYFYLQQQSHLNIKDAIYYMAIADSILESGKVLNFASIPESQLITPQNGVVVIHLLLAALGLGHESRLLAIVIINYLFHVSAIYPLYKIAQRLGLRTLLPLAALLGLFLGDYYFYHFQLIPINDGIFIALSVWLSYLIINSYDKMVRQEQPTSHWLAKLVPIIALSAILVHFRLQTLFVLAGAFLAAIVAKRPKFSAWIMIAIVLSLASLFAVYSLIDIGGIANSTQRLTTYTLRTEQGFFSRSISFMFSVANEALPPILFRDFGSPVNLVYTIFVIAIVLIFISGLRRGEFPILFIALLCLINIFAMISGLIGILPRYLAFLFPLFYLFILLCKWTRPIGYAFITIILIMSFAKLRFGFDIPESENHKFWRYLYNHQITLPAENPLLLSENPHRPYLFLKARSFVGELTWGKISTHQSLFLVGNRDFLKIRLETIEHLAQTANHTFKLRNLAPGYQDNDGFQLLELYDFASKSH